MKFVRALVEFSFKGRQVSRGDTLALDDATAASMCSSGQVEQQDEPHPSAPPPPEPAAGE